MKYLPLKFHASYILFTLAFSLWGPLVYRGYNKGIVFLFMIGYLSIVTIGYHLGVNNRISFNSKRKDIFKLVKRCINISVLLYLINVCYLYSIDQLNLNLLEMGKHYNEVNEYYLLKKESSLFTFEILFLVSVAVFKYVSLVLGFFYYKSLSVGYRRRLIFLLVLIIITHTISAGNQKSVGDIIIFASMTIAIRSRELSPMKRKQLMRKIGAILMLLLVLLSYSQYNRLATRDISAFEINRFMATYKYYDLSHPIFEYLGYKVGFALSAFIGSYLAGGYYGLSVCLQMPFVWTYGIGNSQAITGLVEKIFGVSIYEYTYLNRMDVLYNVPGKQHWHTIFPWLASDFTFVGTLMLMGIVAFFYGKAWKEVILYKNPISLLLFALLSIAFVFLPANNQILHGFDYLMITVFVVVFWKLHHKKFNKLDNV